MTGVQPIDLLLQAAQYLERREREAEHGYASIPPRRSEGSNSKRRKRGRKSAGSRSTHNEMEKNRRAHLRLCLERLKNLVPIGDDNARHTTLSLLMKAKLHIETLEEVSRRALHQIDQLQRQQRHLKRQLELLSSVERARAHSTSSTVSSEPSDSDQEDVDVDVESTDVDWSSSGGDANVSDSDEPRGPRQR
ncbi:max dimerization protein 1-like [Stegostoma tigrinum]|uniref:max dimerization protein 1-like n=1 Tax=Stegostoma tigrinum TaxID=3053191 RepID=UPI002870539F|nr:max dimerization protein 1-like [Stegostoma tigrinum]